MIRKRLWAMLLAALILFAGLANAAETITNAEKLWKQLEAGSGFSADWSLDIADQNGNTILKKPFEGSMTYIYIRPDNEDEEAAGELCVTIADDEGTPIDAAFYAEKGENYLRSSLLGDTWYRLPTGNKEDEDLTDHTKGTMNAILSQIGMPSIVKLGISAARGFQQSADLNNALDQLAIETDIWLESYRNSTVLGKTDDGKSILTVSYAIPAQAIKTQLKELIQDVLSDSAVRTIMIDALNLQTAQKYLDSDYLSFYQDAIDALPLSGEALLERTVYISGGTAKLYLSLPLYDAVAGECVISYNQQCGRADEPDEMTITLESGIRSVLISFQQYESMTGVSVLQGEFYSDPVGNSEEKSLSFGYVLTGSHQQDMSADSRSVYTAKWSLLVIPLVGGNDEYQVPNMQMDLTADFISGASQKAATEINAALIVGGDDLENQITLTLNGKSRKKWEVESIGDGVVDFENGDPSIIEAQFLNAITKLSRNFAESISEQVPEQNEAGVENE